jgi:type IV pilus assembly protein PilA
MKKKGFTLVELMVVILIVAILAAVAIPILRGRLEAARWSEGKAMMGSIATAIRAYAAEAGNGAAQPNILSTAAQPNLGFLASDLTGTYFTSGNFSISSYTAPTATTGVAFTVSCTNAARTPTTHTLTDLGAWDGVIP